MFVETLGGLPCPKGRGRTGVTVAVGVVGCDADAVGSDGAVEVVGVEGLSFCFHRS